MLRIECFSDVLCVWAYGGDVRFQRLREHFAGQIEFKPRFVTLFGAAHQRIESGWKEQGAYAGFNAHLHEVCADWPHIQLHADVWLKDAPQSSLLPHLFLKEAELYLAHVENGSQIFNNLIWQLREAFFRDNRNISRLDVLQAITAENDLPWESIEPYLQDGQAHAQLFLDREAAEQYHINGSPTLIFNEGRQTIYGNVGYRVIEANINELLRNPHHGEAS
ncbi:MAG: DsbA family protein, partial [gamma proteobacterium symbiont of Bathyaustriella thionipta]|nr:DsbA family protein [gamma proteobacterium symbiont of Bathyaustriella thionipta]